MYIYAIPCNWSSDIMKTTSPSASGVLFILAGIAFIVAYLFSQQVAFIGVGVAFIGIGSAFIARARKMTKG
jgi:membrane-bound ClpP family serine protease